MPIRQNGTCLADHLVILGGNFNCRTDTGDIGKQFFQHLQNFYFTCANVPTEQNTSATTGRVLSNYSSQNVSAIKN